MVVNAWHPLRYQRKPSSISEVPYGYITAFQHEAFKTKSFVQDMDRAIIKKSRAWVGGCLVVVIRRSYLIQVLVFNKSLEIIITPYTPCSGVALLVKEALRKRQVTLLLHFSRRAPRHARQPLRYDVVAPHLSSAVTQQCWVGCWVRDKK